MRRRLIPQVLTIAMLAGCGDDGTGPVDTRIGIDGGTVTSADGKATLVVPAGALMEPVAITIESAPISADPRLVPGSEYVFAPNGLHFAIPAQLSIRFDSVPNAMEEVADYIWLHRRSGNGWTAMEGEPVNLANRTVKGEIAGFSNFGGATSQLAADLLLAAQQLDALLTDAIAQNAIALMGTIGGLLQAQTDPTWQAFAQPFLDGIAVTACNAFASAVGNARDAPVDDWGVLSELLGPAYSWQAVAVQAGAPEGCPNAPLTLDELQNLKVQQFVNFYLARLNPASFGQNFEQLTAEVGNVIALREGVQLLGMAANDQRLLTEAQYPLLRQMRLSAYRSCRDDGEHKYLGGLRDIVGASDFTDEVLLTDLQQCATRLSWHLVSDDELVDEDGVLGGGASPGTETTTATGNGVAEGTITLSGDVREFKCLSGSFAGDELIVTLNGTEVHRRMASGGLFFSSPLELDAETILEMANIDPSHSATAQLVMARESVGCGQYVPIVAPITVARLMLEYPPPGSRVVYESDFTAGVGGEWSGGEHGRSPSGEWFLGPLGSSTAALSVGQLPEHTEVTVEFDLYILNTMDGNSDKWGPDIIEVELAGQTVMRTTFSNVYDSDDGGPLNQAYPGNYPGANNAPATGASATNALGYMPGEGKYASTTYSLSFTVPHDADALAFQISGDGIDGFPSESWGIDNVKVTIR